MRFPGDIGDVRTWVASRGLPCFVQLCTDRPWVHVAHKPSCRQFHWILNFQLNENKQTNQEKLRSLSLKGTVLTFQSECPCSGSSVGAGTLCTWPSSLTIEPTGNVELISILYFDWLQMCFLFPLHKPSHLFPFLPLLIWTLDRAASCKRTLPGHVLLQRAAVCVSPIHPPQCQPLSPFSHSCDFYISCHGDTATGRKKER